MKNSLRSLLLLATWLAIAGAVSAQSTAFTYQGRVQANGADFTGAGQFKFALVISTNASRQATATVTTSGGFVTIVNVTDGGAGYVSAPAVTAVGGGGAGAVLTANVSGGAVISITVNNPGGGYVSLPAIVIAPPLDAILYTTYWSNDGTSVNGSEPSAAVSVPVSNGLFTVVLGGPGLPNMQAIGASVFDQTNLQMRVWFNDGVNGFAALSPVQALTTTPYASRARVAGSVSGTIGAANIATGAVTSLQILDGSITGGDIADGTIGAADVNAASFNNTFWRIGGNTNATGTPFLGTLDFRPMEIKVGNLRVLRLEPDFESPNIIWGYRDNFVDSAYGATISGGGTLGLSNYIAPSGYATIGGGLGNAIQSVAQNATIGGGGLNVIQSDAQNANIDGGWANTVLASAWNATVGGGLLNTAGAVSATVGGGQNNTAGATSATIGGGTNNLIRSGAVAAVISGGRQNDIGTNSTYSAIGGGRSNAVASSSPASTVAGGHFNSIGTNSGQSVIGGGSTNSIANNAALSVIAGGLSNYIGSNAFFSAIGGGWQNGIQNNARYGTIPGGTNNIIRYGAFGAAIGGGSDNSIGTNAGYSTIAGGNDNYVANSYNATIAGGNGNDIGKTSDSSAIGGGYGNSIADVSYASTIGGGHINYIDANSKQSTIGGGYFNRIGTNSPASTIGGGTNNQIARNAAYAMIPGGDYNFATNRAFAAGSHARASHTGAFVWADSQDLFFSSTANNEVSFRCQGGVRFTSGSGSANQTVSWIPGTGAWSFTSDRETKEALVPVEGRAVLERVARLPISEWNYKGYPQRHIGPMAQDFHAAFPLNTNDTTLNTADLHGVALAAIQGLNQKLEDRANRLEKEFHETSAENAALKQRLTQLEALVSKLANGKE